tara:strand:+ start:59 stop:1114 length:1056 start_codon:yes stop_codon:yes gene_type:complete
MIKKEELDRVLKNLSTTFSKNYDSIILCLSFSNEGDSFESYFGGIRFFEKNIILSIINPTQQELKNWESTIINYKVNNIFVDIEKRIPFEIVDYKASVKKHVEYSNIYSQAIESFPNIDINPWSSTEVTSEAALRYLRQDLGEDLSGKKVSIIGLGSIGFQIALSLIREGAEVSCFTRNINTAIIKVNAINLIKSKYTLANLKLYTSLETTILSSPILIECSSAIGSINKSLAHKFRLHNLILDLGKQAFTSDFILEIAKMDINFKRLDVSDVLQEKIARKIYSKKYNKIHPQKFLFNKKVNLISGGWKGLPGDIVVDNAKNPNFIIGIIKDNFKLDPIYKPFTEIDGIIK